MQTDTIAAISTGLSESGIGIIRISGPDAVDVADKIYRSKNGKTHLTQVPSHTIHYGYICEGEKILDEVLVSVMRAPRSFTAEDTVEINCHGGLYALKSVLEAVLQAGARPADPGEFTRRAFLNGRMDLSQAEAVMNVISARNALALDNSIHQLRGSVSEAVGRLREEIIYETARIESALDDPEHYDLTGYGEKVLSGRLQDWIRDITRLIDTADSGRMVQEGIRTVILGRPNAGKSSLMNSLLGVERAIVTQIAGTTRDTLYETLQMDGMTLNLVDTAGIHDTEDIVEQIGVDRALEQAREADLILYVIDSACPLSSDDRDIMRQLTDKKAIILLNKTDLTVVTDETGVETAFRQVNGDAALPPVLRVSLKQRQVPEQLYEQIKHMFMTGQISYNDEIMITSVRQKNLLIRANKALKQVAVSIGEGLPEDFYTIDLMEAYSALGEMTGEQVNEDLIDEIFGKFCMGK